VTSFLIKEAVGNSFLGLLFGPGRYFPDDPCRGVTHGPSGPRINGSDVGVPHKYLQQHEEQMPWRFSAAGYDFPPIRYLAHLTNLRTICGIITRHWLGGQDNRRLQSDQSYAFFCALEAAAIKG